MGHIYPVIAEQGLMYCTFEKDSYHLVCQDKDNRLIEKVITSDQVRVLKQKLYRINKTDYINLVYARKLVLINERLIEMTDGKQLKVSQDKVHSLLSWFLLI